MSKTVSQQILRLEREQARAINQGDIPGATKMFDRAFVGFSSTTHERIRGLAALAKTFQHYLDLSPRLTYRIQKPQVQVCGSTAIATFYWSVELASGKTIHGRGTHVFARRGKEWRVIHEHFSRAH
jgi:ketosteroid isomerase-like protein